MPSESQETKSRRLLSGSLAGATSVSLTYPLDVVRARLAYAGLAASHVSAILQAKNSIQKEGKDNGLNDNPTSSCHKNNNSRPALIKRIAFGETGVRAPSVTWRSVLQGVPMYGGFVPTLLGIVPYAGVSFFTYEWTKELVAASFSSSLSPTSLPVHIKLGCGLAAGAAGQTVSYPLDVIRRRMQLTQLATHLPTHRSMWEAVTHVRRTAGTRGLFTGLSINYLKVAPATAISFVTYEYLKDIMAIS
jgi:Mitochondrial carrier protein